MTFYSSLDVAFEAAKSPATAQRLTLIWQSPKISCQSQSTKASIRAGKTDLDNQQCANTHEGNLASRHILFFQAIVVPYLGGSPIYQFWLL